MSHTLIEHSLLKYQKLQTRFTLLSTSNNEQPKPLLIYFHNMLFLHLFNNNCKYNYKFSVKIVFFFSSYKIQALFALNCRNCRPGSLDPKKVAGKIVVCVDNDPTISRRIKTLVVEDAKATGLIFISEIQRSVSFDSGTFPFTEVGSVEGLQILKYINSTK